MDSLHLLDMKRKLRTMQEIDKAGDAAAIYDEQWRLLWVSEELREILGNTLDKDLGLGKHIIEVAQRSPWIDCIGTRGREEIFRQTIPYYLHSSSKEDLARMLPPGAEEFLAQFRAEEPPKIWSIELDLLQKDMPPLPVTGTTIHFKEKGFSGWLRIFSPRMRASILSLVARGNEDMFERMSQIVEPGRRPVAIMFCDLEHSNDLARRLPSAVYFELLSGIAKKIDDVIVSLDGVVGKHAGDGASAYFLADGDPEKAALSALAADKEIRALVRDLAGDISKKYDLEVAADLRVGLHWGSTVYLGQIVSGGRLEVTALGEEVNVCSRLEGAALGGKTLASKHFLERLEADDALEFGIELNSTNYYTADEIPGVPKKIIKDLGSLPITDI